MHVPLQKEVLGQLHEVTQALNQMKHGDVRHVVGDANCSFAHKQLIHGILCGLRGVLQKVTV